MINHDVEQGSPEWLALRLGIPTASEFDKILTPGGKPSAQATDYAYRLIAERAIEGPIEAFQGDWMERGKLLESDAVQFYELQRDVETVKVGFITDNAHTMGCSPDRLIGEDGLLEIKCPAPNTQVKYWFERSVDQKYYPQVQGQLYVSGRKWLDILAYHPIIKPVIIRVERDETYIACLDSLMKKFVRELGEKYEQMYPQEAKGIAA